MGEIENEDNNRENSSLGVIEVIGQDPRQYT